MWAPRRLAWWIAVLFAIGSALFTVGGVGATWPQSVPDPLGDASVLNRIFVVGAIFSGIAAIIIAMAIVRKVYHLEDYLKPIHFKNLGVLLLVMTLLW